MHLWKMTTIFSDFILLYDIKTLGKRLVKNQLKIGPKLMQLIAFWCWAE